MITIREIKETHIRWMGIPLVALALIPIVKDTSEPLWINFLHSLTFTLVLWNGAFFIFKFFRKKYPEIRQTPRRLFLTLISLYAFIIITDPLICVLLKLRPLQDVLSGEVFFEYTGISLMTCTFIGTMYETAYFFGRWKETFQLNEQLKNQQIRTQFEVLQNQMSPHFLFNSLNTLTTLIAENQELAIDFTQKLSDVYRYILQNKDRELVTLADELEFAKDYLFLLKMRFPDNLAADFRVDPAYHSMHIAPLTIQMLIENSIKHNVVSKAHPLKIDIYVEKGNSIVVKNNLQQKNVIEKSTKTGLVNIQKRYEYLGNRKIDIITTAKNYMVAIPLIQLTEEKTMKTA